MPKCPSFHSDDIHEQRHPPGFYSYQIAVDLKVRPRRVYYSAVYSADSCTKLRPIPIPPTGWTSHPDVP